MSPASAAIATARSLTRVVARGATQTSNQATDRLLSLAGGAVWFTRHPRLYVRGRRIHHGLTGATMLLVGVALMWHDRADWPWPLTDP